MRDYIEIDKEKIPCGFDIILGSEEFNLYFKYNKAVDLFTCTLSKDGETLVTDEPLVYGVPLFRDVYNSDTYPCISIVPYDESGNEDSVTYENFEKTVLLTIDEG